MKVVLFVVCASVSLMVVTAAHAQKILVDYHPVITPANFVAGVTNPYFPLHPGTTYRFVSGSGRGAEVEVIEVLSETKEIMGITATIVHDRMTKNGKVKEDTYDWYAQDKDGNVWYLGEDTREYLLGHVISRRGSWEAGKDGAQPGIMMKARPQSGEEYRQEYRRGIAEDMAKIVSTAEAVTVPFGTFRDCVKTEDWTPLQKGDRENKVYCPGVGLVLETVIGSPEDRNQLVAVVKR